MSLDVDTPPPPELNEGVDANAYDDADVAGADDYRREELEDFLENGAWEDAFGEWAEHTDLTEAEFAIAQDLDLFEDFDFFWDDFADRVGYHAPGITEEWRNKAIHPDLESWATVSAINAGLTELGQTASEVLKEKYIDWESSFDAPEDLPNFD